MYDALPVAVIGAGPIGLAATSNLIERGRRPLVFEAGPEAAFAIKQWQHVRLFTKWRDNLDPANVRLLMAAGWKPPNLDAFPTGSELRESYLLPLAEHVLARYIRYNSRVSGISRRDYDRTRDGDRDKQPFVLRIEHPDGRAEKVEAAAVIDASGTWFNPNPIGSDGLPAVGENHLGTLIHYGIPDIQGDARTEFAGKRVLVVGGGHSAMHAVTDLVHLYGEDTYTIWATRRNAPDDIYRAGRGAVTAGATLVRSARAAVQSGRVEMVAPFLVRTVRVEGDQVRVDGIFASRQHSMLVDRIIAATGFRPDLRMLRELRFAIDPTFESAARLAEMIDPATTNCFGVPRHGAEALRHPETDFFVAGIKSYGRTPTFLLATGYGQVRSITEHLTGRAGKGVSDRASTKGASCACEPFSTESAVPGGPSDRHSLTEPASVSYCKAVVESTGDVGPECC